MFITNPSEEGIANTAVVAAACVSVVSDADGNNGGDIMMLSK
jgi:hypothetical protein